VGELRDDRGDVVAVLVLPFRIQFAVGTVLTVSMVIDPSLSSRIYRFDLRSSERRVLIWRHDCHPGHEYLGSGLHHLHQGPDEANRVPDGPQTLETIFEAVTRTNPRRSWDPDHGR
jgi:hypothetical protein